MNAKTVALTRHPYVDRTNACISKNDSGVEVIVTMFLIHFPCTQLITGVDCIGAQTKQKHATSLAYRK